MHVENVQFKRGIFQGDSLSPLLFILAINLLSLLLNRRCSGYQIDGLNVTHILYMDDLKGFCKSYESLKNMINVCYKFSTDIGMSFGLSKCKVVNIVKGEYKKLGGISIDNEGGTIEELGEDEVYKYLGVDELNRIKHDQMKEKIWAKAKGKLRKLLESQLNSKNLFEAINECMLPVITYSFGVVNWLEGEIKDLDVKIRKMLNMNRVFELKSDVDRLYTPRKAGGRGLQSVWDAFRAALCRISHVLSKSNCILLGMCARADKKCLFSIQKKAEKFAGDRDLKLPDSFEQKPVLSQARVISGAVRDHILNERMINWENKPQHGAYMKLLTQKGLNRKLSFAWMGKCHIDAHTESYICAAQELALFTRYHEKHILKTRPDDRCRVCKQEAETIFHLLSGCGVLAKKEYFDRHNAVCQYVHQQILKAYSIPCDDNWVRHTPEDVIIQPNVEVVYDQVLTTDRPTGANRPDILLRDKKQKKTFIIDVSCPCDTNVATKENEKVAKYSALKNELKRMWGGECIVAPVVIGCLGAASNETKMHLEKIPASVKMTMCQKITICGSQKILQSVLGRR